MKQQHQDSEVTIGLDLGDRRHRFCALPFGRLWYTQPNDAVDYAEFFSRSHDAVIRVYDDAGNEIETHEHNASSRMP